MSESERRPFPMPTLTCGNFYVCVCVRARVRARACVHIYIRTCGFSYQLAVCTIMSFNRRNL